MTASFEGAATPGGRADTRDVVVGAALGGVGAYLFQILGTRVLGEIAYAPVGVLWTLQYLVFTVFLMPVEAYLTRAEVARRGVDQRRLRLWLITTTAAVTGVVVAWPRLFDVPWRLPYLVAAGLTVAGFGGFAIVRGRLAGRAAFRAYGIATASESGLRLVAAAAVLTAGAGAPALGLTLPLGAVFVTGWWLLLGRHRIRRRRGVPQPARTTAGAYLAATVFANGAGQLLLAGGPLAVAALGGGASLVSIVFVTTTAARAPLVFAFGGLLSRVLPPLAGLAAARRVARLRRLVALAGVGGSGLAAAAGLAGAALGPPLVVAFFGEGFRPGDVFAGLTGAAVVVAVAALLLNQVLIALEAESKLTLPWALALAAGAVTLAGDWADPAVRVGAATLVGLTVAVWSLTLVAWRAAGRVPTRSPHGAPARPGSEAAA